MQAIAPAALPMTAAVTLDAGALTRLRELDPDGRHGVVMRVMAAFDTSLTRTLDQLSVQMAQAGGTDPAALGHVAHTLKSSSASIGAMALARLCAEIEQGLRSGTLADLDGQVRCLVAESEAALSAVRAMLRQQAPSA